MVSTPTMISKMRDNSDLRAVGKVVSSLLAPLHLSDNNEVCKCLLRSSDGRLGRALRRQGSDTTV
jgi:hypothetical protein